MTAVVRTVQGRPLAARYETVLAHEHLRIDIRCWFDERNPHASQLANLRVTPESAVEVQQHPFACLDNLVLDDPQLIIEELGELGALGRTLIIDVTPENVGRDVAHLAAVGEATGLDIVYGCGLYIDESRPGEDVAPPDRYRDAILSQFETDDRPAVIGEIGTGDPITSAEWASLTGAAQAQSVLDVPLYVHLHPWAQHGAEVLDLIERHGADLERTVLCHLDVQIPSGLDYHRRLLRRGCLIAFDIWGDEFPYGDAGMPTDEARLDATAQLVEDGFGTQLVHSQDVCTKTQLKRFGGPGFAHIPRMVRPRMVDAGLAPAEIERQLAGNALRLLER